MRKLLILTIAFMAVVAPAAAGINSVDETNFYSEGSDFFNGEVFQMEFTADGNTDEVNVYVGADELSRTTDMGEVKKSISIDAQNTETKARYDFNSQKRIPIAQWSAKKFSLEKASGSFSSRTEYKNYIEREIQDKCYDMDGNGLTTHDYLAKEVWDWLDKDTQVKCFGAQKVAGVAEISSDPRAVFQTEWEISNEDRTVTTTVSNGQTGDGTTTRVGDDVLIEWKGSIGTGKNAPVPTDELIKYSNSNGYTIIERSSYDDYTDTVQGANELLKEWEDGLITQESAENQLNMDSQDAAEPHATTEFDSPSFSGSGLPVADYSYTGQGTMTVGIPALRFPEFDIYANACEGEFCNAFVQIERSVGRPQITSTEGDTFKELSSGNIEATVENVGDAEGSFSARLSSCSAGFTSGGSAKRFNLDSGMTTNLNFPVSFDSSSYEQKEKSGTCTVEVTETTTDSTVTSQASVTGVQMNECNPGNKFVKTVDGRDKVLQCTGDGLQTKTLKVCGSDEYASQTADGYECVDESQPPNTGECEMAFGLTNPACVLSNQFNEIQGGLSFATFLLDLAVSFAAAIGGWFISTKYLYKFLTAPVKELQSTPVKIGMGLVGAFLAGAVIYSFFSMWWIKLLLVIGVAIFVYLYGAVEALIPG